MGAEIASLVIQAIRLNISESAIMASVDGKTGEEAIAALKEICAQARANAHKVVDG